MVKMTNKNIFLIHQIVGKLIEIHTGKKIVTENVFNCARDSVRNKVNLSCLYLLDLQRNKVRTRMSKNYKYAYATWHGIMFVKAMKGRNEPVLYSYVANVVFGVYLYSVCVCA